VTRGTATCALIALVVWLWLPTGASIGADEEAELPTIRCSEVRVRAGQAYLAQTSELTILDVSDPLRPRALGTLSVPATLLGLDLHGPLAFLAAGSHGLYIVDIEDPAAPELVQRFDTPGKVRRVEVRGDLAYLADDRYGLRVVDVSDPVRPLQTSRTLTRGRARALSIHGELLALAEDSTGVRLFDLERESAPRERQLLREAENARDVLLQDDLLLVADGKRGLLVYRLGDRPELIAELALEGTTAHLAASGSRVLVASGRDLHLVDLADPESPREISEVRIHRSWPAGPIQWDGTLAYIAADLAGMAIVDFTDPAAPELLLPRRRPMNVTFPR
jgi:hypothetical protein